MCCQEKRRLVILKEAVIPALIPFVGQTDYFPNQKNIIVHKKIFFCF